MLVRLTEEDNNLSLFTVSIERVLFVKQRISPVTRKALCKKRKVDKYVRVFVVSDQNTMTLSRCGDYNLITNGCVSVCDSFTGAWFSVSGLVCSSNIYRFLWSALLSVLISLILIRYHYRYTKQLSPVLSCSSPALCIKDTSSALSHKRLSIET